MTERHVRQNTTFHLLLPSFLLLFITTTFLDDSTVIQPTIHLYTYVIESITDHRPICSCNTQPAAQPPTGPHATPTNDCLQGYSCTSVAAKLTEHGEPHQICFDTGCFRPLVDRAWTSNRPQAKIDRPYTIRVSAPSRQHHLHAR